MGERACAGNESCALYGGNVIGGHVAYGDWSKICKKNNGSGWTDQCWCRPNGQMICTGPNKYWYCTDNNYTCDVTVGKVVAFHQRGSLCKLNRRMLKMFEDKDFVPQTAMLESEEI